MDTSTEMIKEILRNIKNSSKTITNTNEIQHQINNMMNGATAGATVENNINVNYQNPHFIDVVDDKIYLNEKHILIEPLIYAEYYIGVYDEKNNLLLNRKYYTKSLLSAKITAYEISKEESFKDFPIYICNNNPLDNTINYEKIVLKYKNEDTPETTH